MHKPRPFVFGDMLSEDEWRLGHAVPATDVLTPNQFELEQLVGALRRRSRRMGRGRARRTWSARHPGHLGCHRGNCRRLHRSCRCEPAGRFRLRTPRLSVAVHGAGDAVAALFFAQWLCTGSAAEALSRAASSIFCVLQKTAAAGAGEMLLIEAQQELLEPSRRFLAEPA